MSDLQILNDRPRSKHPKRIWIETMPWPNPESVYKVTFDRSHHVMKSEYYLFDQQINRIIDLVGYDKFHFEVDGGTIRLFTLEI